MQSESSSIVKPDTIKLLLLGDSGVGKSSLLLRFTDNTFSPEHVATIGVDYKFKFYRPPSAGASASSEQQPPPVKLMLWDTAGQERFRTLTSSYYRGAQGVIMVYDVGQRESFEAIKSVWLRELEAYVSLDRICLMIVGNKIDLVPNPLSSELII